jgi:murein DD-endopeptidase MepM/ murein hydrolase activator NlpD
MSKIRSLPILKQLSQYWKSRSVKLPTIDIARSRRHRLLLIVSLLVFFGIIIFQQQQLQALEPPKQPIQIASSWRKASFPVENFQAYTSGFGYRTDPITGKSQFHNGLDIAAPLGSYVRNWWTGRVVALSDNTNCGTMVKIQSGQWQHTYCHLNGQVDSTSDGTFLLDRDAGIQLWLGQQVPVGARIGSIGMTGRTTGPHLHWILVYNNQYVDPAEILRAMYPS